METELSKSSMTIPVFCICPFIVTTMETSSLALADRRNVELAPDWATTST